MLSQLSRKATVVADGSALQRPGTAHQASDRDQVHELAAGSARCSGRRRRRNGEHLRLEHLAVTWCTCRRQRNVRLVTVRRLMRTC
jgi:hypothetical protein